MRHTYFLLTLVLVLFVAVAAVAVPRPLTESRPYTADGSSVSTTEAATNQTSEIPSSLIKSDAQPAPVHALSPMMVEIKALLDTEKHAVEERRNQMTRTTNMVQRVALIDEIHQLKINTELEILRVQLRYAQQDGRLETVQQIEEAIEFMTNPCPVPAAEPRPEPEAAHQ